MHYLIFLATMYCPPPRRHTMSTRPLVAFLLVASFGILFAGCGTSTPEQPEEEFNFTEEDVARFRELARDAQEEIEQGVGTGTFVPRLSDGEEVEGVEGVEAPVLDLSNVKRFESLRAGPAATGDNLYRVTNVFLNVRSEPRVTAAFVTRLDEGNMVKVLDFVNAAWAQVRLMDGMEGYVATRYIAKIVPEDRMAEEKQSFEGLYFVDFGFLNVRKEPDVQGEKLGELQGQEIVRPLHVDEVWARVPFNGEEGYVAREYLTPFLPTFLVRQDKYLLPVLHYRLNQEGLLDVLPQHIASLRSAGYTIVSLSDFYDLVLKQEQRDVRLEPNTVILAISDVSPENITDVSDALLASNVTATLFVTSQYLGLDGITERQVQSLLANGFDLQSGGHTGDDLRSLTNFQLELELKQSRRLLEKQTGKDVFVVAYPWGGVNERVMEHASDSGYLFGLSSAPQRTFSRSDFLQLPSFLVSVSMSGEDVLAFVEGE